MPRTEPRVAGLVLAAGGSRRLGQPKQLLPYRGMTLLGHVMEIARACRLDRLALVLGGASERVRARVDLSGAEIAENPEHGSGCASSIAAGLEALGDAWDVLVLMLGDQPGVTPATVAALLRGRGDAALAACRYDDGRGHPLAFSRAAAGDLATLRGDKAVWKLLDAAGDAVAEVRVPGPVPLDVDTWEDYEALLAGTGSGAGRHDRPRRAAAGA